MTRLWSCLAVGLLLSACRPAADEPDFCTPSGLEPDLVRIARTTELHEVEGLAQEAEAIGLRAPLAAAYEFSTFPYKPVFYFVVGTGLVEREALLEAAIRRFGGTRTKPFTSELAHGDTRFLCTEFDRGRGMVAMSVACTWNADGTAGYGIRLAGASLPNDFTPIAAMRETVARRAAARSDGCPDMPWIADLLARPADREQFVRDAVAAIHGFALQQIPSFFPDEAPAMFRARLDPPMLRGGSGDPVERVTHALGTLKYPRSETAELTTLTETRDRVVVHVSSRRPGRRWFPALLPMLRLLRKLEDGFIEATRREAEMVLVRTGDGWRIDPEWAIAQVQDWYVKTEVLWSASPRAGDLPPGVVPPDAPPHLVHLAFSADGGAACLSARSASGERFMKREDSAGPTLARGPNVPDHCPTTRLGYHW